MPWRWHRVDTGCFLKPFLKPFLGGVRWGSRIHLLSLQRIYLGHRRPCFLPRFAKWSENPHLLSTHLQWCCPCEVATETHRACWLQRFRRLSHFKSRPYPPSVDRIGCETHALLEVCPRRAALNVPADVDAYWQTFVLTFVPDYANMLNIRLNYHGSAIFINDTMSTLAPMLGLTADITTDTDKLRMLESNAVKLDILWREEVGDAFETFVITVPQKSSRGYTVAQVKDDINSLVKTHLANVASVTGAQQSPLRGRDRRKNGTHAYALRVRRWTARISVVCTGMSAILIHAFCI